MQGNKGIIMNLDLKDINMKETLFVTDLDGTLMRNDKSISEESISIINELIKQGMTFTVATA